MPSSGVADRTSVPYGEEIPRPLHRLSVAQYDAMGRAGILGPDDRVELLDGLLCEKMTKNPPTASRLGASARRSQASSPPGGTSTRRSRSSPPTASRSPTSL